MDFIELNNLAPFKAYIAQNIFGTHFVPFSIFLGDSLDFWSPLGIYHFCHLKHPTHFPNTLMSARGEEGLAI